LRQWLALPAYQGTACRVLGPVPAAIAKVNNRYRYRLTLITENNRPMREMVAHLLRCAQADKRHRGVSITADVDPMN
ncbi:MAG: hypothetical protein K2F83_00400, partial [Oscillospiraceae bacterium]|nr:hypothetical protein [Oscillospiraceae bacterium]